MVQLWIQSISTIIYMSMWHLTLPPFLHSAEHMHLLFTNTRDFFFLVRLVHCTYFSILLSFDWNMLYLPEIQCKMKPQYVENSQEYSKLWYKSRTNNGQNGGKLWIWNSSRWWWNVKCKIVSNKHLIFCLLVPYPIEALIFFFIFCFARF